MLTAGRILCYFVMAAGDAMVEKDPGGSLVFTVIGASRALQGMCNGLIFVMLQVSLISWVQIDIYISQPPKEWG